MINSQFSILKKRQSPQRGVSLIEVVIATSIITLTLVVLVTVYSLVARYSLTNIRSFKATGLAEEGVEALGFLRDASWTSKIAPLALNTTYRLYWNGSAWTTPLSAPLLENRYDVTFRLTAVNRDASFNVVSSGGTTDSSSRKAAVSISWREGTATTTKTLETYIFNTFNN